MATWKEKGVVPDSDDEEDWDSQGSGPSGIHIEATQSKGNLPDGENVHAGITEGVVPEEAISGSAKKARKNDGSVEATTERQELATAPKRFHLPSLSPDSSSGSPSLTSDRLGSMVGDGSASQASRISSVGPSHSSTVPQRDDISRSYVQISPVPAISSSPLSSNEFPLPMFSASRQTSPRSSNSRHLNDPMGAFAPKSPEFPERRFRPRKDIQLHPYQIEHLKYQQKMKDSHIKPLRITETQEDAQKSQIHGNTSDLESEDEEFQASSDIEVGSQRSQQGPNVSSSQPSLPQNPMGAQDENSRNEDSIMRDVSSDDDLPDVHELLSRPVPALASNARVRTYSKRSKQSHQYRPNSVAVFSGIRQERPASPPTTSSPIVEVPRFHRPPLSITPREPTPSLLEQDELQSPRLKALPTPATSAVKSAPSFRLLDDDSDDINLPASRPVSISSDTSDPSSSDESEEIREVIKRSRHVLPASHFRLDLRQQQPKSLKQTDPSGFTDPSMGRRLGVAIPKPPGSSKSSAATPFLIESDDDENTNGGLIFEDAPSMDLDTIFDDTPSAIEYDTIDPMLPKRKRRTSSGKASRTRKRIRTGSSSTLRQPKITSHLTGQNYSSIAVSEPRRRAKKRAAPRLSILDVLNALEQTRQNLPLFIKIAARTSKTRKDKGSQSPSMKHIRLATREDTYDALTTLSNWRNGKIQSTRLQRPPYSKPKQSSRLPLGELGNNYQSRALSPGVVAISQTRDSRSRISNLRKTISLTKQRSMDNYVTPGDTTVDMNEKHIHRPTAALTIAKHRRKPHYAAPTTRPAQLESSDIEHFRQYPSAAFRSNKRALDTLYRKSRFTPSRQDNLALRRFLADEDETMPIASTKAIPSIEEDYDSTTLNKGPTTPRPPLRPRKRVPQRIDANAAMYRQPSEPLAFDMRAPKQISDAAATGNKLQGLGPYGTRYAQHFDVFPLQDDVRFHEETFIGRGHLSNALKCPDSALDEPGQSNISLRLDGKEFIWGLWNAKVSSEMGVCFDWVLEQLSDQPYGPNATPAFDVNHIITRVVEYVKLKQTSTSTLGQGDFVPRMLGIFQDFKTGLDSLPNLVNRRTIEALSRITVIVLQVINISKRLDKSAESIFALEDVLKSVTERCVCLLLMVGLDDVRKLYDDLQYATFRAEGIKEDRYLAQAWVILMIVLETAQIPRRTFWDVTYAQMSKSPVKSMSDIRLMEQIWSSIFSLLPLSEFDNSGALISDRRYKLPLEAWSLPQQLLKRVFSIYNSNARQSPSFNDYCRALVGRCRHLMVNWGWWKCNAIIGTIFDFFASHKLAHLRNEEVYKSPRFLEQLDGDPSLDIEPEDRCFHIFLKIVAQDIQHMRRIGDIKGARNMISRLTPNHNRQYLKEEAIHQRDLASLRNHHDLLCTLYWAAPSGCEPPSILIQNLVAVDRSHREACLINIRAWANLARFVLNSPAIETSPEIYHPFLAWQNDLSRTLLREYHQVESQVRSQVKLLPQTTLDFALVDKTISRNRRSTMSCIQATAIAMIDIVKTVHHAAISLAMNLGQFMILRSSQRSMLIQA